MTATRMGRRRLFLGAVGLACAAAWIAAAAWLWRTTVPALHLAGFDEHRYFTRARALPGAQLRDGRERDLAPRRDRDARGARDPHDPDAEDRARDRARPGQHRDRGRDGHLRHAVVRRAAVRDRGALVAAPLGPRPLRRRRLAARGARCASGDGGLVADRDRDRRRARDEVPAQLVDPRRARVHRDRGAVRLPVRLARGRRLASGAGRVAPRAHREDRAGRARRPRPCACCRCTT